MTDQAILVLRLAAPLQSWGGPSRYNRRETLPQPTKSGVLGLLAAAEGRPREASIADLVDLDMGVRVDQPGTLLRDYHTVSDHRGLALPSAKVDGKRVQKRTTPAKYTGVTQRYYLQDAVFVVALRGSAPLLAGLERAVRHPAFPLSLGRRSCPPTGRVSLGLHHDADLTAVLGTVPWEAAEHHRRRIRGSEVTLEATVEDPAGEVLAADVPDTYDLKTGTAFGQRAVRHLWVRIPTGHDAANSGDSPASPASDIPAAGADPGHDPFALLGW
ncbi:type I-E CRISPR-associated protein Cas5/CasD [Streptomyces mobaraensis NBRC 13819 = DSM 40847]|uniref:Putative CRISPR-associated protein n=1 Tax=Streptomyces mobaraensis (strain ATCC 29032 / DSM 40847 / JCM 4168 / NBRC 13819 / NCIMB 11159 / IPCR 16-22) TaxID=1223523 RepID=M3CDB2_STRM1|nr:type I-E CRISPR-associated protein Cas5/CasD [Streptomyces mobaraensis]EMF02057.1 putative CRISPR-associated protein [Streptomyces mobaraensis NBRC 13819 = DSM 40847]QTT76415.1 type I-E CRISPR-associated protein Cas5/CasD [Streptomyces mobaraensis NBRC 13819 = DSM 40847]